MPLYTYKCSNCNAKYEKLLKIANRKEPLAESCPRCEKVGHVDLFIAPVPFIQPTLIKGKNIQSSHKEVMKIIKKGNPTCNVPDY